MLINTGGRDLAIDKLAVRGQEVAWSKVIFTVTTDSVSADLACQASVSAGSIRIGSKNYTFSQASNDLTLQSGKTMIIYIKNPDSITINDIGLTVSITLYTAQAMYYRESNVQAYSTTTSSGQGGNGVGEELPVVDITFGNAIAVYDEDYPEGAIEFTNNEDTAIVITGVTLNGHAGTNLYAAIGDLGAFDPLVYVFPDDLSTTEFNHIALQSVTSVTVQPGATAAIYFQATLVSDDLNQDVILSLTITGFQAYTRQITVGEGPSHPIDNPPAEQ